MQRGVSGTSFISQIHSRLDEAWTTAPVVDVHVIRVGDDADLRPALRLLSPDELRRSECFRADADRRRFGLSHAALRMILAARLSIDPCEIAFETGAYGKPHVPGVEFNLAHSGGLALVATASVAVGVDVERLRPIDAMALAGRYFSPAESRALRVLPPSSVLSGFFAGWARKEAFIKATGEGLARPLDQFDVSLGPVAALMATRPDAGEVERWTLRELDVGPDHAAALCVRGCAPVVNLVQFGF